MLALAVIGTYGLSHVKNATSLGTKYQNMYDLVNQERVKEGLKPLQYDRRLEKSAHMKACDMVNKNYWSHKDPDGKNSWYMFEKFGYKYVVAGENLARDLKTDEEIVTAFMNSPTHEKVILEGRYEDIGLGKCGNITVLHFGKEL